MAAMSASEMTRSSSSSSSALSNINVKASNFHDDAISVDSNNSTLPTTVNESGSATSRKAAVEQSTPTKDEPRGMRKRKSVNYNVQSLSENASGRNVSGLTGNTLVDDDDSADPSPKRRRTDRITPFPEELPPRPVRRPSVKDRVKNAVASVLGKRGRTERKMLRELELGTGSLLDELDLDAEVESARPAKKLKKKAKEGIQPTDAPAPVVSARVPTNNKKKWLTAGLYVGQAQDDNGKQAKSRKLQKQPQHAPAKSFAMPLPMFDYIQKNERQFKIPFDIFASWGDQAPKDWKRLDRNKLVGEAKEWFQKEAPLAMSRCICEQPRADEPGCGEDCLNRAMHYECDDSNCRLPRDSCGNRAFADLAARKDSKYGVGVEPFPTANRGWGVKACRAFKPGDIVMEYNGEIISEAECQRRMREDYGGKPNYYIMEFDQGLHIDGTKGSMARFVNHSCEPNCEVRMVKVGGTPRMAIFAGSKGLITGEELTYDYNFDNFGESAQNCYCGAPSCRGTLSRRLNATEQKQKDKEDKEKQRIAEIIAKKAAAAQLKKQEIKNPRPSGWRGWVDIDDKEVRAQLKQEKAAKEEASKNTSRAQRLLARASGFPAVKRGSVDTRRRSGIPETTKHHLNVTKAGSKRKSRAVEDNIEQDGIVEPASSKRRKSEANRIVDEDTDADDSASIAKTAISKFSEHLPEVEQTITKTEVTVTASISKRTTTKVATSLTDTDELLGREKSNKDGSNIIKSAVQRAVQQGFKKSMDKMRQSTLKFTKL